MAILTEPVVNPEVRDEVPNEHVVPAELLNKLIKDSTSDDQAEIAKEDELGVLVLV